MPTQFQQLSSRLEEWKTSVLPALQSDSASFFSDSLDASLLPPFHAFSERLKGLNEEIIELKSKNTKFLAKANETDPEKKVYGPGMCSKIKELNEKFAVVYQDFLHFSTKFEEVRPKFSKLELEHKEEEERKRVLQKREEERRRLEAERKLLKKKEQEEREAKLRKIREQEEREKREREERAQREERERKLRIEKEERERQEKERKETEEKEKQERELLEKQARASASQIQEKEVIQEVIAITEGSSQLRALLQEHQDKLVIVDWFAPWCGPCKLIAPFLVNLALKHAGDIVIAKVDCTLPSNQALAAEAQVSAYPTFQLYSGMKKIEEFRGANKPKLVASIELFLSTHASHSIQTTPGTLSTPTSSSSSTTTTTATATATTTTTTSTQAGTPTPTSSSTNASTATPSSSTVWMYGDIVSMVMKELVKVKASTSYDQFVTAVKTMLIYVRNVLRNPSEQRFRKVGLNNAAFKARVAKHEGGMECMKALGFRREEESSSDGSFIVMDHIHPKLHLVQKQLEEALAASGQGRPTPTPTQQQTPPPPAPSPTPQVPPMPFGFPNMTQMAEVMNSPMFQTMLNQVRSNPQFMEEMMRSPMAQNIMRQMDTTMGAGGFGNPSLFGNPFFGGNAATNPSAGGTTNNAAAGVNPFAAFANPAPTPPSEPATQTEVSTSDAQMDTEPTGAENSGSEVQRRRRGNQETDEQLMQEAFESSMNAGEEKQQEESKKDK